MEENENTGVIYCITNIVDGKKYIGQALSYIYKKGKTVKHGVEGRFKIHKHDALKGSESCPKLYNAMRNHGIDNFKTELIKICLAQDLLNEETKKILELDTIKKGYNVIAQYNMNLETLRNKDKRLSRIDKIKYTMKEKWTNDEQYIKNTTQANLEAVKKRALDGKTRKCNNKNLPNNIYKTDDGYDIRIMRNGEHKITSVTSKTKLDEELLIDAINTRDKLIAEMEKGIIKRHNKKLDHNGNELPKCISAFQAKSNGYKIVVRKANKRIDRVFTDSTLSMDEKLKLAKEKLQEIQESI